jgi:hypothetical protein
LQSDFDLNSLKILGSSHEMRTEISNNNFAFYFDNILLADSVVDEPNSHGFVTFQITPKADVAENTEVKNTAFIYFDFNEAIQTNTTLNTLVTTLPIDRVNGTKYDNISNSISLFPNPANGNEVFLKMENGLKGDWKVMLTDLSGREIQHLDFSDEGNTLEIDISKLEQGFYFLQISQGNKRAVKKFIKQ